MSSETDLRFQLTEAQVRAAMNGIARDTLRPAALGIGLLYVVLSATFLLVDSWARVWPVVLLGFATSAALLGFYVLARRHQFPTAWAHPLGVVMAGAILANIMVQHWRVKPHQYTNFALLIVGAGFLILDTRWLVLVMGGTLIAWGVTVRALYPSVSATSFLLQVASTVTVAAVVSAARVRTLRRLETLRLKDQYRKAELEKALLALQHNEARFRTLSNATFEGILFHDRGRILDANQAVLEMFGYELHEVRDRPVIDFVTPESVVIVARRVVEWDDTPFEVTGVKRDGTCFPIEIRGKTTTYQQDSTRVVAVRDISQRKQTEEALHQEQQRYQALFDHTNDGVFIVGLDRVHLAVNQRAADMLGYAISEIVGQPLGHFVAPEETAQQESRFARLLAGEKLPVYERTFLRKDGTTFPAEVNAALVCDSEGRPLHIHSIARDVTERKRTELEREQAIHDLEAFAQNVAHDLKNPLGLVLAYTGLLRDDYPVVDEKTAHEYLDEITEGANKMSDIIGELLLLAQARYGEVDTVTLDMEPLVMAVRRRLALDCTEMQAEFCLPEQWPRATGYGPWIEEVWFNYISNALKYGGVPPRIVLGADAPAGGQIRFWVRDNGAGLSPEQRARLFAPFTQLHQIHSRGHGLGLSIVRHIVEKLGGQVGVESTVGQGSLFYFTLPEPDDPVGAGVEKGKTPGEV